MKLEELQELLAEDLKIDLTKLQYEASRNPVLYAKWLKIHSDIKKSILISENNKKKTIKAMLDHYTGRGEEVCMTVYDKSELKTVIPADKTVIKTETALQYLMILLDFTTRALDAIKARGFSIKHIIDCRQFENGSK